MTQAEGGAGAPQAAADPLAALKAEAEAARAARDHARARDAYRALIAAGAKGPSNPLRLARACHALGDAAGMEEALARLRPPPEPDTPEKADSQKTKPPHPATLLAIGEVLQLLGRHGEAVEVLRARQATAPLPPQGWRLLARALRAQGREREALAVLRDGCARHPEALGLAIEALRLEARLDPERLEGESLDRLVAAHPQAEAAQALRLELLTRLRRPDAEAAARAFLAAFPDSAKARAACAALDAKAGDHAAAAGQYRWLLDQGSASPGHALGLARSSRKLNDPVGIEEALAHLAAMPDTAQARRIGAEVLRLLDRHEEAVTALRAAAELEPLPAQNWRLLIDSLQKSAEPGAALAAARQACAAHPDDLPLRLKRLELTAQQPDHNPVTASAAAAALVAMHSERPEVHLTRLRLLKAAGDTDGARAAAATFLEALPEDRRARLECARLAMADRDHDEALLHYRALRAREPERCEHLVQIARCCDALGDMEGVVDSLIALERQPESAARERAVARILQIMQLYEEAIEALERSIALAPEPWASWPLLINLLIRLGRGPEAVEQLKQLPPTLRELPQTALLRAKLASALGRSEEAIAVLRQLGGDHSFASRQQLVTYLIELGRLEEAEAELEATPPANAAQRAQLHRARAAIHRWRYDGAAVLAHCEAALAEEPEAPATLTRMAEAHLLRLDPQACLDSMLRAKQQTRRKDDRAARPRQSMQGQIANEVMLEPEAHRLPDLVARCDSAAVDELAAWVRHSRNTGPAKALLIAARRSGLLDPPAREMEAQTGRTADIAHWAPPPAIPPLIHQYWEGTMPPDVQAAIDRMQARNPWAEHRLYDRRSAGELLKRHGLSDAQRALRIARHAAERADIFRLAVLALEGGFYADVDDLCVQSLAPLAPTGVVFLCRQEQQGTAGNNFIAAAPEHPIIADALEEAVEETLTAGNESIWLRTGPGLLTRACARHMARIGPDRFAEAHRILTSGTLSHYLAINRPLSYKLDKRNWAIAERQGDHRSPRELYAARRQQAAAPA